MSAWTDGKIHVVLGPTGLSVHRGEDAELVLAAEQLGGPLPPIKKGKVARLRPLAIGGAVEFAYTINVERKLVRTGLGSKRGSMLFPWDISALASAESGMVCAAYVTGTKARALTSIVIGVPPADPKAKWEHEYEGDRPVKVEWPDELLWDKAPWSRKTRWSVDPDQIEIDVNIHGYAVYDRDSAVVGVLRRPGPKQLPSSFACVLRTPMDNGTTLAASATARGFLVATGKGDGHAALCEFADDGKLLRHVLFDAKTIAALSLAGPRVFLVADDRLRIFDHELAEQSVHELGELGASELLLRPNADGTAFTLAVADRIVLGRLAGSSWTLTTLDLSAVPQPGKAHAAPIAEAEIAAPEVSEGTGAAVIDLHHRIIGQAPGLSLDPNQPNDAWTFPAGAPFEIVVKAVSVGGPAETGLYVEVEGAAVDKGLIEPDTVAIEGTRAGQASFAREGKRFIARLPDVLIPAGVEPNKDKKIKPKERYLENPEDTFVTVRLHAKAGKVGSELVYVRVGFDGIEEGKLMRGRPLTITEG